MTAVSNYGTDLSGTAANRPSNAPAGVVYYATDTDLLSVSKGDGTWSEIAPYSTAGTSAASEALVLDANQELNSIGVIRSFTKLITSAQVLALNATPIELLAAVGAGNYAEFLGAYVFLDFNSAAYVDDAGEDFVIQNLSGGAEVSHSIDGGEFDGTADALVWCGPKAAEASATTTLVDNGGFEATIKVGEWITGDSPLKVLGYYRLIRKAALEAIS